MGLRYGIKDLHIGFTNIFVGNQFETAIGIPENRCQQKRCVAVPERPDLGLQERRQVSIHVRISPKLRVLVNVQNIS
ncbi:Protein of unknown function [Gryllus bimaculatus]|nr:Protein of unknown function [Gryllus bimaculatus]